MSPEDQVLDWLRDAHAMEEQAEQMLTAQASRLEHYDALRTRIEQHIDETRRQGEQVRACIERLGGSTSAMKDLGGKTLALFQGMSGLFVSDEVVKGVLASYAFEHMEIASYRILAAAAEAVGDLETKRVCESICREEEAMAGWLHEHMGQITVQYLRRTETPGATAKR